MHELGHADERLDRERHDDHDQEPRLEASGAVGAAAALLAAWGVFIRLNTSAEELEPEALEYARSGDREVE